MVDLQVDVLLNLVSFQVRLSLFFRNRFPFLPHDGTHLSERCSRMLFGDLQQIISQKSTHWSGSKSTAQTPVTKHLCTDLFLTTSEVARMKSPIRQERAIDLTAWRCSLDQRRKALFGFFRRLEFFFFFLAMSSLGGGTPRLCATDLKLSRNARGESEKTNASLISRHSPIESHGIVY